MTRREETKGREGSGSDKEGKEEEMKGKGKTLVENQERTEEELQKWKVDL